MWTYLTTARLILRRFDEADEDHLVDLDSDPAVMRFIAGGRATSRETVRTEILPKVLCEYEVLAVFGAWAAVEKETGAFVGWFHLRPPDGGAGEEVELGYRLRRSAWGNGYATEGSRALVSKAFVELGVQRVFATTMTVNAASRRVMEKVGLAYIRTVHLDWEDVIEGSEKGDVEYAITRADWDARSRSQEVG